MVQIIHENTERVIGLNRNGLEIPICSGIIVNEFWRLAALYPDDVILWVEKDFVEDINYSRIENIFHHKLIMASYAVKNVFLKDEIGYIDQLPFININRKVSYGTWQMSSDIGGIYGDTANNFRADLSHLKKFDFLLNSIGKVGQQNSLFCYSTPELVKELPVDPLVCKASKFQMIKFVYSHYKTIRFLIYLWCLVWYERRFPVFSGIIVMLSQKFFGRKIILPESEVHSKISGKKNFSVDVIIPTLNRKKYLLQFLKDLKDQTVKPERVIIIEQNPIEGSKSDLPELKTLDWPFKIVHHFTHKTGACSARNLALEEVRSEWIFFADDDIRIDPRLLQNSLEEIYRLGVSCLNLNCLQDGDPSVFLKIKQWGSFGSGTTIVRSEFCQKIRFDRVFEHGFGEDQDFGIQLRNRGCDVIYHPSMQIRHLKAPQGGFREVKKPEWDIDDPKPSPTLMVFAKKNYYLKQLKGFKVELFLRFFSKQDIKNPFTYYKVMQKRWMNSEKWAEIIKEKKSKEEQFIVNAG